MILRNHSKAESVQSSVPRPANDTNNQNAQQPIKQECGGGNCAVSVGQQGGITVGQLNVGRGQRNLSDKQKGVFSAFFAALPEQIRVMVHVSHGDEPAAFGQQMREALTANRQSFVPWDQSVFPDSSKRKGVFIRAHRIEMIQQLCSDLTLAGLSANCELTDKLPEDLIVIDVGESDSPYSLIPPSQDNSVHIERGSHVEQRSSGDCSPNIIGASNTVNCGPPPISLNYHVGSISKSNGLYEREVEITASASLRPVEIAITCSTEVEDVSFQLRPSIGVMMNVHTGVLDYDKRVAVVGFDATLTPSHTLTVIVRQGVHLMYCSLISRYKNPLSAD